jgi:nitroreductase
VTINERAPEGDRDLAAVHDRLDMSLREAMETQRAVRRVLPDPVDDAVVMRCIELALKAPTGSNGQNWEFVVVKDQALKTAFAKQYRLSWKPYAALGERTGVTKDPGMAKVLRAVQWQVDNFENIPVIVVPALRTDGTSGRIPLIGGPSILQSSFYGSIYPSVQNLLLAARSLGLGASLITLPLWNLWKARKLLGMPATVTPVCMVPMGWPQGRYGPTTRRAVEEVVHFDRYRRH